MPNPTLLVAPVVATTTYPTVPAGNNRFAVMLVHYGSAAAVNVTVPNSITINGVSGSYVAGDAPGSTQLRAGLTAWAFKEPSIAAISGGAVSITGGSGGVITRAYGFVVQDTSQVDITRAAHARVQPATGSAGLSIALTRAANSYTVFAVYTQTNEPITLANPARDALIDNINIGYEADTAQTANSTSQLKTYVQSGVVINFESVPSQAITDVNGGAGVIAGSTGNTASTSGFNSAPTSGTLGGKSIIITNYNSGTGVATFTAAGYVDGQAFPDPDTAMTLTLQNDTESASINGVPNLEPAGISSVTLSGINTAGKYLGAHIPGLANGDKLVCINTDGVFKVNPNTEVFEWQPGTERLIWWRSATTGIMTLVVATFNNAGEVISVSGTFLNSERIRAVFLSSSTLTASFAV